MNFEERLAQTQAKLEELKAKINASFDSAKEVYNSDKKETMIKVAKMDAAIEDFGKDVAAQIYCDVSSLKQEAEADASAMSEALGNIDAKIDAKLGSDMEKYDAAAEKLQAKVDDDLATIEGDINAAEENVRLAKERKNSKLNATRLKLQMHQEEVKNRIEAKKTAIDKDAQEELIMDLLDYADDCQQIAYSYVMEAELAILDACDEIEEYEAKYGKFEPEEK